MGRRHSSIINIAFFGVLCGALSLQSGCVQTLSKQVDFNDPLDQDKAYYDHLTRATRDSKVFRNFETVYAVSATYLSPEFRGALARRYEDLFKQPQPMLEEASSKAGFFVTIYGPDRDNVDLTNSRLWSIFLQIKDQSIRPVLVKRLSEKEQWRPFFEGIHPWSHEFLILFDTASITPNDPSMVDKTSFAMTFASADAKVNFNW